MDTVFQPGLKIKTTIRDGRIYAPGIGDDTRNIEALLATIRALDDAQIKTKGDLVFVFTTDEETGLTGAKAFRQRKQRQGQLLRRARWRLRRIHLRGHRHQLVPPSLHRAGRSHTLAHAAIFGDAAAGPRH